MRFVDVLGVDRVTENWHTHTHTIYIYMCVCVCVCVCCCSLRKWALCAWRYRPPAVPAPAIVSPEGGLVVPQSVFWSCGKEKNKHLPCINSILVVRSSCINVQRWYKEEMSNTREVVIRKSHGRKSFIRSEGNNVKMDTKQVGCDVVNSFELAGNRAQ